VQIFFSGSFAAVLLNWASVRRLAAKNTGGDEHNANDPITEAIAFPVMQKLG